MKKTIKKIIILIGIILSICLIYLTSKLSILPNKYILILTIIETVLNIIGILTIMSKNKILKIISIFIYIIIIISSIIGIKYGKDTLKLFKIGFNNNNIEIKEYNVIVLKESKYNKLEELKTLGYLENTLEKNNYLDEIKIDIDKKKYKSIYELYEDLLNKNIESIILNGSYIDLLEDDYNDIKEKIKIIYSFDIKEEKEKQEETKDLKPINIYISGSDSRSGLIETNTRTDVNMIMTINPETKQILLTSIPRDYYVRLHNTTGYKDKLTHSGIYGIEMSKKTLEDLFDIKIDYVVKVGFQSIIKIIDLIGGIDIYSDQTFTTRCNDGGAEKTYVKEGLNHFTGAQALSYARERYAYLSGDNHRILNQQQVLEAIITQALKDKNILKKYSQFIDSFTELYRTDIPNSLIKEYIKNQLEKSSKWTIEKQVVRGTGSMNITYSMPGRSLYVMIPDEKSLENATNKIKKLQND